MRKYSKYLNILAITLIFIFTCSTISISKVSAQDAKEGMDAKTEPTKALDTANAADNKKDEKATDNKKDGKKDEKKWYDKTEISAETFLHYGFKAMVNGEKGNSNDFNVDRVYLNFKSKPVDKLSIRVTSDVETSGDDYRELYLKYAYASYTVANNINATFGLQATHWVGYVDGFWGYRFFMKSLTDNTGVQSSADVGFSISTGTKKSERIADILDLWVGIINGAGYKKFEASTKSLKNPAVRVGVTPIDNDQMVMGIAVGYMYDFNKGEDTDFDGNDTDNNIEHIVTGLLRFEMKKLFYFHVEGMYGQLDKDTDTDTGNNDKTTKYMGISVVGIFNAVPDLLDVVGRFDMYNPDLDADPKKTYMTAVGGINYKVDKKMLWVMPNVKCSWESVDKQDKKNTNLSINLDVQAKF